MDIYISHEAALYDTVTMTTTSSTMLQDGLTATKALFGSKTAGMKLFLSPTYVTDYPGQAWQHSYTTLSGLAADAGFQAVFGDNVITKYYINTFTFVDNNNNQWINTLAPNGNVNYLATVTTEIQNLTTYLLNTYAGTGKQFILQNWEGDWELLGNFTATTVIPPERPERMAAYYRAFKKGIDTARHNTTVSNVTVLMAMEVNRSFDPGYRCYKDVIPYVKPDMISFSSYEAIDTWGPTQQTANAYIQQLLTQEIRLIQQYNPGTPIFLGELGWPELLLPGYLTGGALWLATYNTAVSLGLQGMAYWVLWDNTTEGFYIYKPDGTLSSVGNEIKSQLV